MGGRAAAGAGLLQAFHDRFAGEVGARRAVVVLGYNVNTSGYNRNANSDGVKGATPPQKTHVESTVCESRIEERASWCKEGDTAGKHTTDQMVEHRRLSQVLPE